MTVHHGSDQTRPDRGKPDMTSQATSICTWTFAHAHHGLNFSAIGTFGMIQYSTASMRWTHRPSLSIRRVDGVIRAAPALDGRCDGRRGQLIISVVDQSTHMSAFPMRVINNATPMRKARKQLCRIRTRSTLHHIRSYTTRTPHIRASHFCGWHST